MSGYSLERGISHRDTFKRLAGRAGRCAAAGLTVAALVGGGGHVMEILDNALSTVASHLEPSEYGAPRKDGRIIEKLTLTPIIDNLQQFRDPAIRTRPIISARELTAKELQERGINITQQQQGIRVWGGDYNGDREPRSSLGRWAAIIDRDGKVVGYVAENFVTYLPKEK